MNFAPETAAISADGRTALLGVSNLERAFVFVQTESEWSLQAELLPIGDPYSFAWSVALSSSGDVALVGDPGDSDAAPYAGAVNVYVRDERRGWSLQEKIVPPDPQESDWFGFSVALAAGGDVAVIRGYHDSEAAPGAGAVYIFGRDDTKGWIQRAKLFASNANESQNLGNSVDVSADGQTVVAGVADGPAAAYVFGADARGNWFELARLEHDPPSDGPGRYVALAADGRTALVGVPRISMEGSPIGSAFVFVRENERWLQQARLYPQDVLGHDDYRLPDFGLSLALSNDGNLVLVGAHNEDVLWPRDGAAYLFQRSDDKWFQSAKLLAMPSRTCVSARLSPCRMTAARPSS